MIGGLSVLATTIMAFTALAPVEPATVTSQAATPSQWRGAVVSTDSAACPTYDLASLFFEDYYPGTRWGLPGSVTTIRWTPFATVVHTEVVARAFSNAELALVREAFAAWDAALSSIEFREVAGDKPADVAIGWTALGGVGNADVAYWTGTWFDDGVRFDGSIRLRATSTFLSAGGAQFRHTVLHELGNLLGLGDIRPTDGIASTQEDPLQPPYVAGELGAFDRALIRQVYGESTCPDSTVSAPVVTFRIRCTKGTKVRVVRGPDPSCPRGFRQRGRRIVVDS